jgi:hypothetical protein
MLAVDKTAGVVAAKSHSLDPSFSRMIYYKQK